MKNSPLKNPAISSLLATFFVSYPNFAWLHCEMTILHQNDQVGFLIYSFLKILYFWLIFYTLFRYNLKRIQSFDMVRFASYNFAVVLGYFGVFESVNLLFSFDYERFFSILTFQFLVIFLITMAMSYVCYLYLQGETKERELSALRIENLESRCNALTNQINPHFFFNSLNGITSLVRKNDNEVTISYIGELSDVFRYILQSERKGLVPLSEEIDFVHAFLHVLSVRYANKLSVDIQVPESSLKKELPVLSLLPLLENVTVHNTVDSDHLMNVKILVNENEELVVCNTKHPKLQKPSTNGTGLRNLEHRYRILKRADIRIEENETQFQVILPLNPQV